MKDIVASKSLNMRSIWCRELIMSKVEKDGKKSETSEVNLDSFKKTIAGQKVLQMSIGTDDYLTTTLQNEFADAIVDSFSDVAKTISAWHKEGMQTVSAQGVIEDVELPDYFSIVIPDDKTTEDAKADAINGENK